MSFAIKTRCVFGRLTAVLVTSFFSVTSLGYFSTMDTGEVLPSNNYRIQLEPQLITTAPSGLNLNARFDAGVNESSNVRAILGFGRTDFHWGLMYKWVPIPDYEGQPALGIMGGFEWARDDDKSVLTARIHPIISKEFGTDIGKLTPYASVPIGLSGGDGSSKTPIQLALGTGWKPTDLNKVSFLAEAGLELNDSFSYVSVAAQIAFDEEGIAFE
ncbi:MAG: hypothetical protein COT74_03190 [Bdellovibrionales bacterium CG10_big_fil_rev_8_21_14_0_10_45_34]|nr:MAG: hypothetical protein COT74_03190 [Bdellovibrionales bacterium CG10_big_fil_rev_8_21_14_0_10_45_34]